MNDTMAAAVFQAHERTNTAINQNGWKVNTSSRVTRREWMAVVLVALAARLAPGTTAPVRPETSGTSMPVHA